MGVPVPPALASAPVVGGLPVPWFVAWVDGRPDLRVADAAKVRQAVTGRRCWVCGGLLVGSVASFVVGPSSLLSGTSAEPPCHRDCAVYSARACPFLARPERERRPAGLPEGVYRPPGRTVEYAARLVVVWSSGNWRPFAEGGGWLWEIGRPTHLSWWMRGRPALAGEAADAVEQAAAVNRETAYDDGPTAAAWFEVRLAEVLAWAAGLPRRTDDPAEVPAGP